MGTNPAPHLADIDCYAKESKAMDDLFNPNRPANTNHHELAMSFSATYRYIDDILSIDNPAFDAHVRLVGAEHDLPGHQHIYPDFLSLNKTTEDVNQTDFLGMSISSYGGSFLIDIASSKKKFPVDKINYPSLKGNFPKILGYGVFTGQLHRLPGPALSLTISSRMLAMWAAS